jgi:hypothetical protein
MLGRYPDRPGAASVATANPLAGTARIWNHPRGGTHMTRRSAPSRHGLPALLALALAACVVAPAARAADAAAKETAAAEPAPAPGVTEAPESLIDPAAVEPVKRMVQALTSAKSLSYEYDSAYDTVQDDGEILEFGGHGAATVKRPDHMRGEVWERGGRHLRWAWDGKDIVVYDDANGAYATTPRTGDIDSLVDFLRDDIGLRLPLADLFTTDLGPLLVDRTIAARYIGKETLRGVETEHVALRGRTGVDVQLWIATGEHALPQRVVLNFSTADGRPQFRADLHDWKYDPRVRDSAFEVDVPKSARKVPFMKPRRSAQADAGEATTQ